MSVIRRLFGPRRVLAAVAGGFSIFSLTAGSSARAAEAPYPDIMPLNQLKAGMTGYGLTTFHGTTITRFEVKIIGILKKENLGRDLILIRMTGGPITERGANLIHGMSGSPIYINGKLIGAFSMGEAFPKEPTGMVTPIEDMLDSWDPKIPQRPTYFEPAEKNAPPSTNGKSASTPDSNGKPSPAPTGLRWQTDNKERVAVLAHPITIGNRHITRIVLNAPLNDPHHSSLDTAVMHRATSFMFAPGISESSRKWFQEVLNKRGYAVTLTTGAGGGMGAGGNYAGLKNVFIKPGSCFGTFLATGDVSFGGFGTVTYRRGERILGFGHPLMGLGALEGAITSAYVVDVFSGYQTSHLIPVAGPTLGTLRQDRNFSVSGDLAHRPHLIPFDVTINDRNTHRTFNFHSDVFQNPDLTSALLALVAKETIARVHNIPGDVMADVTTTVDSAEVGSVTRTNRVFDAADISGPATQDLNDITNIVSGNPFYPLPIRSVKMKVDLYDGHDTATIERIYLKQGRFEPGDTIDVGVMLKPYRRPSVLKTVTIKIPSDTPSGRYQLAVRGGMANMMRFGGLVFGGAADPQTPPVNVRQMVARLGQKETNTDLVGRLILNSVAPALEGEKLSQLPPNLSALMRSDRNSGVRLERDEIRSTAPTEYVVSGTQQLVVTVVRKNTQEPTGPSFGTPSSLGGGGVPTIPLSSGSSLTGTSVGGGDDSTLDADSPETFSLPENTLRWLSALQGVPPTDKKAKKTPPTESKPADSKATATAAKPDADAKADPPKPTAPEKPTAPDLSSDKPVGRQLQLWRQTARPDFQAGKFSGSSVAASGDLRLTASLRRLATTKETYIWALVPDSAGNLYAGTGSGGKILKVDAQGASSVLATLPVVAVQSLLYSAKDNALYAGSGGKGNVYRIAMDGSYKLLCALPEKYVLALAQDSDGGLYVAPGGGGNVYRLTAAQLQNAKTGGAEADVAAVLKPETFFKTNADHIMALLMDPKNNLYVGTGNDGILYKVTPAGVGSVIYDAKENAISGLAMTPNGDLYAVTGPKGMLYKITPSGETTIAFDRAASFYTAIRTAPDGTLYASTVNAVFHIFPSPADPTQTIVLPLDNPKDVDFLTIAVQSNGTVAAGTGNIGEIYTSQADSSSSASSAGTYTSVVHDAKLSSRWGTLRWEGAQPDASSVTLETRTGSVAEPDATWTDWAPVRSTSGTREGTITSPAGRFIQYRLTLHEGKPGQSPAIREVTLGYLPRNQAPKVAFTNPAGGERWSKTQTLRWNGTDPDNDTLTYDITYSTDAGATWKPLPASAKPAPAATTVADTADSARIVLAVTTDTPEKMLAEYKTKVAAMNLPESMKASIIEEFRINQERKSSPPLAVLGQPYNYQPIGAGLSPGSPAPAAVPSQRENSKSVDTTLLPDGSYWFKVVASDRVSNPVDAQTTMALSEPVLIVNAVPKITFSGQPMISSDKRVHVEGVLTQSRVTITAGQYRIDGGDWFAAAPTDGLFDAMRETFSVDTTPLTSGKHTIEVEAFNSAGGKSLEKIEVTIP
ncbi:MAG: Virginiamycin lyase [Chthonomonadaceae bacterium]|nr:Virginiamycin lyase [Chthonomonadaceae bacterium]